MNDVTEPTFHRYFPKVVSGEYDPVCVENNVIGQTSKTLVCTVENVGRINIGIVALTTG